MHSDMITFEEYRKTDYVLDNRATMASPTEPVRLLVAPKRSTKKKAFVSTTLSKNLFVNHLVSIAPKLFFHHQLERVQRQSFTLAKTDLKLGHLVLQMDFAENMKLILQQQR